ncbi:MAG: trehalase family glycosidase [Bacteroidota bacterium]
MDTLKQRAKAILRQNWRGAYTIPTSSLYPFQWNWDSGFISIGHSHQKLDDALQELASLFSGQWANGMIPHIIFHSENETTYFPNHDFWDCSVNSGAPQKPKTSGITQPPVHGFVLENLLDKFPDNEQLLAFARQLFPKIVHAHRFFYSIRDPFREGLCFIFHPWESGRDNSPLWDVSLDRIQIDPNTLPAYTRKDTSLADADVRPTTDQYDRYVYLLQLGKKHQYDGPGIVEESPFLVQDSMMNAILIKSNDSLIHMGKRLGMDTGEVKEWQQQAKRSFNAKCWNEDLQFYTPYDLRAQQPIQHIEIGGLVPLFAGIPNQAKANTLNTYLQSLHERNFYLCPSFDVDSPLFDSKRYWRGPIWPQMNWMIYKGLKQYGFEETSEIVRADLLALIDKHGFYEYFEAQKALAAQLSRGYGGNHFSWTASCALDLMMTT